MPVLHRYRDVTDPANFQPAPLDWQVVITDVVNSTGAIESGHYKNVNVLGATTIIGLLNVAGAIEFPFVFGGDGASFLIPPTLTDATRRVLIAAKKRAREAFQLELRGGMVPVKRVMADGFSIHVAKLRVSDHFAQAVFTGGGISRAEQLVKRPPSGESYEICDDPAAADADFSGLECRWNPVRSDKGEVVSLLVQARGETDQIRREIYQEVIGQIESIFGEKGEYHPVAEPRLTLTSKRKDLLAEFRTKRGFPPRFVEWFCLSYTLFQNAMGNLLLGKQLRFAGVDWGKYKKILIQNTDHQKFDDMVRMVISCSPKSRRVFEAYLERERALGRLVYGLHVTDHALLTCLVFDRYERHFHFVDGSNGGYALAAKSLKLQIKESQKES
jgi:hypothetical protein